MCVMCVMHFMRATCFMCVMGKMHFTWATQIERAGRSPQCPGPGSPST